MLSFESDYLKGACPEILASLGKLNDETQTGYGLDRYSASATEKIRLYCEAPEADVYYISGGTQTNALVISTMLHDYEGAVAAETGHIFVHEAGSVEYTGHKVLTLPQHEGKIDPAELENYLSAFQKDGNRDHMVWPGLVYISHPTEYGTLYTLDELQRIYASCKKHEIPLFVDGARLGYGLMSKKTDVTLPALAKNCDVFYIGGTKVGALFGEAVVFPRNNAPKHFYTMTKQHGAMLAKGFVTGLMFDTLFTDDLYFKISAHAIDMAEKMIGILKENGLEFFIESPTNQQFLLLPDEFLEKLSAEVRTSFWEKPDDRHTVVRFATSWYTEEKDLLKLSEILKKLTKEM